jgi:hypothetical protein
MKFQSFLKEKNLFVAGSLLAGCSLISVSFTDRVAQEENELLNEIQLSKSTRPK